MLLKTYDISLDLKQELKNIQNKKEQYTIPVFIPHKGCNNECVFCNQKKISGHENPVSFDEVDDIINSHLKFFDNAKKDIEIAFFGGSFTGIDIESQIGYLKVANKYIKLGYVKGIRISTRPDYINKAILNVLKKYNVSTIELGVQSMDEKILALSKRGHLKKHVIRASKMIHLWGFELGMQIMIGLPGSTLLSETNTIKEVLAKKPSCLRIYPVYVLGGSELYTMYKQGEYIPLTLDLAINRTVEVLKICSKTDVKIIRIGLQSTDEITSKNADIAGPICDNFAEYVLAKIVLETIESTFLAKEKATKKAQKIKNDKPKYESVYLNLYVPSKYISIVVGPKKINKKYMYDKYNVILNVKGIN